MFARRRDKRERGERIASLLASYGEFRSHSRFIDRHQARKFGLVIDDLEKNQALQDAVLSVFHATTHTFNATPSVKIIENHMGEAFLKMQQFPQAIPFAFPPVGFPQMPQPAPAASPPIALQPADAVPSRRRGRRTKGETPT